MMNGELVPVLLTCSLGACTPAAAGERIDRYDIAIAGRRHRREAEIERNNPHQPIIHRPGQRAAIEHQLGHEA